MLFRLFLNLFLSVIFCSIALAQDTIPEDVQVGGNAICKFIGNTPVKKINADGNRLVLIKSTASGKTKGSIIVQVITGENNSLIDTNVFALFGEVPDVDSFLNGKTLSFKNTDSDLSIKKTKDTVIKETTNLLPDASKGEIIGTIKITNHDSSSVSGKLKLLFKNTIYSITQNNEVKKLNKNNKRIIVNCTFSDVSFANAIVP